MTKNKKGWTKESERHALAKKGIKTKNSKYTCYKCGRTITRIDGADVSPCSCESKDKINAKKQECCNSKYPVAVDYSMVGKYPMLTGSGGGYVWSEILEYRVFSRVDDNDDVGMYTFNTYEQAEQYAKTLPKYSDYPHLTVLIKQNQYIQPPDSSNGKPTLKKEERITEWMPQWLTPDRKETKANVSRIMKNLTSGVPV
jgi:hypothetical protein